MPKPTEIVRERKYKAGYIIRDERWLTHFEDKPKGHTMLMKKRAYTLNGDWIGDSKLAYRLIVKWGIMPELANPSHNICSIGFCKRDGTWAGWSHRAIQRFGIGDKLFVENFKLSKTALSKDNEYRKKFKDAECADYIEDVVPFREHGYKTIETLDEARQAAVNFANYVS